jgi:hypothetical protein
MERQGMIRPHVPSSRAEGDTVIPLLNIVLAARVTLPTRAARRLSVAAISVGAAGIVATHRAGQPTPLVPSLRQPSTAGAGIARPHAPHDAAPTGQEVIRRMHDRYASSWYSTLSFTELAETPGADGKVTTAKWWEEAKLPGRLRIDIGYPATDTTHSRRIIMFASDSTYVATPGKPVQRVKRLNLLLVLGFDVYKQPVEHTVAQLESEGFDLSRVHEGVWRERPAYVVGAAAGDTTSKQFWIDRERQVFLRMIEPAGTAGGGRTDAWFADYRPLAGGWIAAEVGETVNGVMQLHEVYADIKANVPLPDGWFDPSHLR